MAVGQTGTERTQGPGALPSGYDEYRLWRRTTDTPFGHPTRRTPIWPTAIVTVARGNAPGTQLVVTDSLRSSEESGP